MASLLERTIVKLQVLLLIRGMSSLLIACCQLGSSIVEEYEVD